MIGDPDMMPVRPYPGAPDQLGVVRRDAAPPRPIFPGAPDIKPADPAQWGTVVPLAHPLIVDGQLLDKISIRRLTGDDITGLVMADDNDATLPRRARALACGVHPELFGALSADDAEEVGAALRPFLPSYLLVAESDWDADPAADPSDL
ncbi:hypothetical protein GCM10019059_35030 [Camelimonas fluminis]|uniref:Phage tail assembly protein n=1 Tax=Camelimonas fluminis TaxID=1576911 RepID=A0ABV7UFP6_9HYPH|nr:phage tail assembly protein [Camelimonas fluminis]GHE72347.1 hypothetical protein GCM10019059_35030 [Camelimonas fluminis]